MRMESRRGGGRKPKGLVHEVQYLNKSSHRREQSRRRGRNNLKNNLRKYPILEGYKFLY